MPSDRELDRGKSSSRGQSVEAEQTTVVLASGTVNSGYTRAFQALNNAGFGEPTPGVDPRIFLGTSVAALTRTLPDSTDSKQIGKNKRRAPMNRGRLPDTDLEAARRERNRADAASYREKVRRQKAAMLDENERLRQRCETLLTENAALRARLDKYENPLPLPRP